MIWFIIPIVAVVLFVIYEIRDDLLGFGEIFGFGILIFFVSLLCSALLCLVSSGVAECEADKTYSITEDVDIYAMQDNLTTGGSFFLGSGHIDDELKYFYVEKTEFGYSVTNVDADNAYIQYSNDRCHLEKHTYTFNNWFVRLIAVPCSTRYVFYIPEGSIINNYSVDLK